MERQVGQAEGQDDDLRAGDHAGQRKQGQRNAAEGAEGKQDATDQREMARENDADHPDCQPAEDGKQDSVKRQHFGHCRPRGKVHTLDGEADV